MDLLLRSEREECVFFVCFEVNGVAFWGMLLRRQKEKLRLKGERIFLRCYGR